jgi:hypothetical protein
MLREVSRPSALPVVPLIQRRYPLCMGKSPSAPDSLIEAVRYFSDPDVCLSFMVALRWPDDEVACPHCGSKRVPFLVKYRRRLCHEDHPRRQFTIKVGTIFEDSPIPLEKWLPAVWLIVNAKNGISSYEAARELGVTQKTGWFMLHRIRLAMRRGSVDKFKGDVEARDLHRRRRPRHPQGQERSASDGRSRALARPPSWDGYSGTRGRR